MLVSGSVVREGTVLVGAELKTPSEVTETGIRLRRPLVSPIHVYTLVTTTCLLRLLKNGDIQNSICTSVTLSTLSAESYLRYK